MGHWLTKWAWFYSQLRLLSLERSHGPITMRFEIKKDRLTCQIEGQVTRDLLAANATRSEHREYYASWVERARDEIQEVARSIPRFHFSAQRDVVFIIAHTHGMGASAIATAKNGRWTWREDVPQDPS